MFDDLIQQLPSLIESRSNPLLYLLLCISAILENLIPPVPGDVVTAFGAFLVGTGKLDFFWVYISTTIGSVMGFVMLFLVGKFFGKELIIKKNFSFFNKEAILKAEKWVQTYGIWLVLANRFLPGIRSVISLTTGFSNLSTYKVVMFSFISSSLWNCILIYLGYSLGNNWIIVQGKVSTMLSQYSTIIGLIFLGIAMVYFFIKLKKYVAKK
ncbi:MAG: DedA family protein [Spirochaetes bacterium]|nr:DedA family protein [Spirochaetota bacterium]